LPTIREAIAIVNWHMGRARYVFIHIPKNAGVSIRKSSELSGRLISADPYFHKSRAYTRALAQTMKDAGEHHGFQHARWRDLDPKVTGKLQAVAIVRNPWSRTVSRWRFGQLAVSQGKASRSYVADSFEAFLEERHIWGNREYYWHRVIRGWYPQSDYVTDEAGELRVDMLRFEHLADEAVRYFGISAPVRKRNVTAREAFDYRSVYTPKTVQIVADWYREDIERFGFDFDTPATRNVVYA